MVCKKSRCRFSSISKKGQVTVFIIIGIVILFTFAAVLFITKTVTEEKFFTEGAPVISKVPAAFTPLQLYTENCLNLVGKQGLLLLGQQGGYVNPAVLGEYSLSNPTSSVGINLEPTKVPYWYHNSEADTANVVTFSSFQPDLSGRDAFSINSQLERYVEENLDNCLVEYEPLEQRGFTVDVADSKEVSVGIRDGFVGFTLKMEVDVEVAGGKAELDTFYITIPLDLKHYYEVAKLIKETEEEFKFLEKQGMELISVYSRKDPTAFAPTSDLTFELFSGVTWSETNLKQKFKEVLGSYVPLLKFLGSNNFYYSTFDHGGVLSQKLLDNMVIPLAGAEDVAVRFDYLDWEPYFKTNSDNDVIRPNSQFVNYNFLQFGFQQYETHYDASYPVLVTITDEDAFDGEGYNFVFALESNIRNNVPAVGGEGVKKYERSLTPLVCKKEQRSTELIKTVVVDSFSKEPLELVKIGFSIPEQAECEIGVTNTFGVVEEKYPAVYGGEVNLIKQNYLTNFYPIDTYKTKDQPLILGYAVAGTTVGSNVIEMDKIQTIPVTVKKKQFQKCVTPLECKYTAGAVAAVIPYHDISCEDGERQCFFDGSILSEPVLSVVANQSISGTHEYFFSNQGVDLDDAEEVIITFERVTGFNKETRQNEYSTSVSVSGSQQGTVDLYPGIYKVSGIVTDTREVLIPEDERCFGYTILTVDTQTCQKIDESKVQGMMTGSFNWNSEETYFEITPEDLYTSEGLTFFVTVQDWQSVPNVIPTKHKQCGSFACLPGVGCGFETCASDTIPAPAKVIEEFGVIGSLANISSQPRYRNYLEPQWT
jgi:hypothetical protein